VDEEKHQHRIKEVAVGKSKDSLDTVGDHSILLADITTVFGVFIKYRVVAEEQESTHALLPVRDAFNV